LGSRSPDHWGPVLRTGPVVRTRRRFRRCRFRRRRFRRRRFRRRCNLCAAESRLAQPSGGGAGVCFPRRELAGRTERSRPRIPSRERRGKHTPASPPPAPEEPSVA